MNEHELRELLKLIRGVEHYIEKCLKTEQEKNEDRLKEHLANTGVAVNEGVIEIPGTEHYAFGSVTGKTYKKRDSGEWQLANCKAILNKSGFFLKTEYEVVTDTEDFEF